MNPSPMRRIIPDVRFDDPGECLDVNQDCSIELIFLLQIKSLLKNNPVPVIVLSDNKTRQELCFGA